MKYLNLLLFLLICISLQAQKYTSNLEVLTGVYGGNNKDLPFWFTHNIRGQIDNDSNILTKGTYESTYNLNENSKLNGGLGLLYQNGRIGGFQIDQFYLRFSNKWMQAILGARHPVKEYEELSSTNGNILWSSNIRAIPGILIEANKPLRLFRNLSIDWGIGHYELGNDRFVKGTRIHYKRLGAFIKLSTKSRLQLELQHYAQWSGESETLGSAPNGFSDFVDIFFARRAGNETALPGDKTNALGNHLGSYNINYSYKLQEGNLELYHQHLFEDGSGTAFKNFPDGIYGVFWGKENSWLKAILYEFVYTLNQSGKNMISGNDNYFTNSFYRSGWRYKGRVIGVPFITPNTIENDAGNNRIRAHHLGIKLEFKKLEVSIKGTVLERLGSYRDPINPKQKSIYSYVNGSYIISNKFIMSMSLGVDYNSYKNNVYGIEGALKYDIF